MNLIRNYTFKQDDTVQQRNKMPRFFCKSVICNNSIFNIILVLLVTSKGAAGVTGSAFVTLAATLSIMPTVPLSGLVLILGIDRFMSEGRAITNLIGNATAAVAIDAWKKRGAVQSHMMRNFFGYNCKVFREEVRKIKE